MTLKEFEVEFLSLGNAYKTKELDKFSKMLIKRKERISFLKDIILEKQQYHRIYFQVSLAQKNGLKEKMDFIEENFDKLQDWWHVDQLPQFLKRDINFSYAYTKAVDYVNSPMTFVRRWGYVIFMPTLVKAEGVCKKIFPLLKKDEEYYVQMAEAWLLSDMAVYHPEKVYNYLKNCKLDYKITGRAIQKICDSYRICDEYKQRIKGLRKMNVTVQLCDKI